MFILINTVLPHPFSNFYDLLQTLQQMVMPLKFKGHIQIVLKKKMNIRFWHVGSHVNF